LTQIQDEIEIRAPVNLTWEIFTDFESYAIWNPFIRRVIGPLLREYEQMDVFLQPSGQRGMRIYPEIRAVHPPHELIWNAHILLPYLLYGKHTFRLRPSARGTLFFQRLQLGGLFGSLIGGIIYSDTLRGMVEMDAALKVRVEAYYQARTLPTATRRS
jgi:hypothetical protein